MVEKSTSAAYVLVSAFEEIEKSEAPDKTKVQILVREARRIYSGFKIEKDATIRMLDMVEGESKPTERDMKMDKAFRASIDLYEKFYNADAALENHGRLIKYYYKQNQFILDHFMPFYDYAMRLLNRIDQKIELNENVLELETELAESKDKIADLENQLLEKEKEKERESASLETAKKKLQNLFDKREEISKWLNILPNRELFPDPLDARIMAIFLAATEPLTAQMVAEKLRQEYTTIKSRITYLRGVDVLLGEKDGKETFFMLSKKIPAPTTIPEESESRRLFNEMRESQEREERP